MLAWRIGVKSVLYYENHVRNRSARELGESDKKGFDIPSYFEETEPEDQEINSSIESYSRTNLDRLIEVKGSVTSEPQITLTPNEWVKLGEHPDKYYIYIVTDTLEAPKINIIKGQKLKKMQDEFKRSIEFSKIRNMIEKKHNVLEKS